MKPDHVQAEFSVISCLLLSPELIDKCGEISDESFGNHRCKAIFGAIKALNSQGLGVDSLTAYEMAKKLGAEELELSDVVDIAQSLGTARGLPRYVEIVKANAEDRAIKAAVYDAMTIAESEDTPAEKLEKISASIAALSVKASTKNPRKISEFLAGRLDHYQALAAGETVAAWPTGLYDLDKLLSGGLRPTKVYVVAARPKVGKSSFSQQIAFKLSSDGLTSLLLSQEMEASELVDRSIANAGRVAMTGLLTGKISDREWSGIYDGVESLINAPVFLDDQAGLTLADIRRKARQVPGLKVLAIDYLQLCAGSEGKGNRNAEIEEISRGIKQLAKDLNCAVILLSQLNRAVEQRSSKKPMLSDLRDSGSIEQDADAVIFLWPVKEYDDEPNHRLIGCAIEANRCGPCGEFGLDFRGTTQTWACSTESVKQIPVSKQSRSFD